MMVKTTDIVDKKKAGKTLDQIKAEGLPDEWKSWAWQFITTDVGFQLFIASFRKK